MTLRSVRSLSVLAAAVVLLLAVTGCATGDDAVVQGGANQIVAPGGKTVITYDPADRTPIGDVSGPNLLGDGTVNLDSYKGEVVVVNVWASWCPPCRKEAPELEKVYQRVKDQGAAVVGINFRDNRGSAQDFARDRGLTYPSIYDYGGQTLSALGVPVGAVPTTVVLDRELRPVIVYLKAVSEQEIYDEVQRVLAEDVDPR